MHNTHLETHKDWQVELGCPVSVEKQEVKWIYVAELQTSINRMEGVNEKFSRGEEGGSATSSTYIVEWMSSSV